VSGDFFAPQIEQPIDQRLPVDELILGVRAIGEAHVTGQPKLALPDDADEAAFCVTIAGTVNARTIGRKGPVQIHSRSETRFVATKRVAYHPGRGFLCEPAQIEAHTNNQVDRLEPDRKGPLGRVIERRAWARVADSQEEVRQIVQDKAEAKIRESFDRLLDERLTRLNRLAEQQYLVAAVLGGSERPVYRCCTQDGALLIAAAAGGTHAGPMAGDVIDRGRQGPLMQLWVHEGVLGDRWAALLRGIDLTRRALVRPATPPDTASRTVSRGYDFVTAGDWFVVHSGAWHPASATVAQADGPGAAPQLADSGGGQ
jgi:hypothetical protein